MWHRISYWTPLENSGKSTRHNQAVGHSFIYSFLSRWVPTEDATFSKKESHAEFKACSTSLFWLTLLAQEKTQIKETGGLEMLGRAHYSTCDASNLRKFAQLLQNQLDKLRKHPARRTLEFQRKGNVPCKKKGRKSFGKWTELCICSLRAEELFPQSCAAWEWGSACLVCVENKLVSCSQKPCGLQQGGTPRYLEVACLSPQTGLLVLLTTRPVAGSALPQNTLLMCPLGLSAAGEGLGLVGVG